MINWEKELISLFDDALLADVRPLPPKITADDRLAESFLEIAAWVAENDRKPSDNSDDFRERILYRRLKSLRNDDEKTAYLKTIDTQNLLS